MGEYLSPGVYVEEVSSGSKPMAGVGTSTGAFVGIAERGPIGAAQLVTNWTQFVNTFGGFMDNALLAYGVHHFFQEGGTRCFVVRTCRYGDTKDPATAAAVTSAVTLKDTDGKDALRVWAASPGKWGDSVAVAIDTADKPAGTFKLRVSFKGAKDAEVFDNLTMGTVEDINESSTYIRVEKDKWTDGGNEVTGSQHAPAAIDSTHAAALTGGGDGVTDDTGAVSLRSIDYIGDESGRTGLHAFDAVDDINIVAIPDCKGDVATITAALAYCEKRKDCFFVADSMPGMSPTSSDDAKSMLKSKSGYSSTFGAVYYPWIRITDPATGKPRNVPPSGAVAGIYARTDVSRGVHKAPAGITDGYVRSAIGVERMVTKGEADILYSPGINVIRSFPGTGVCIWGARTVASDPEWRYLNVRRLFLFIEETIDKGSQWVVFEPNDPALWGKVKRNITAFLTGLWRDGALFGATPEEAFFVKVDAENNPPDVIDAGRLIIEVGVAPVKPAEFVIIRISQKTLARK